MPEPPGKPRSGDEPTVKRVEETPSSGPPLPEDASAFTLAKFAQVEDDTNPPPARNAPTDRNSSSSVQRAIRAAAELPEDVKVAIQDPKNVMNQYVLVNQIGKGGMGTVWRAFDRSLKRWCALKFLIGEGNEEGVLRFKREAELSASLHHPNIAPVYEVGEYRGQHFLAMEYIDGPTLATADLPLTEMVDVFIQVVQGVEAAHKKGVIHRDIKPQNIMLTSEKWPFVMDFGLAKSLQGDSSISVTGAIMGTPAYMPPEQAAGKNEQIDAQTDVYSLGATLYAVLTRKPPFASDSAMEILMKVCTEEPPTPRSIVPETPVDLETIVLKAMSKRKEDRYATAAAFAEDLRRYRSHQEIKATRPSALTLVVRKVRRNFGIVIAAVSLAIVAGTIVFFMTRPKPGTNNAGDNSALIEVEKQKKRDRWIAAWNTLQDKLDFKYWAPGDPKLAENANKHLGGMAAAEISVVETQKVARFYREQAEKATEELERIESEPSKWRPSRIRVARTADWSDVLSASIKGRDSFNEIEKSLVKIRGTADPILAYKGTFNMRIALGPYAQIVAMTCDGKDVAVQEQFTPVVMNRLPVGDYVLKLRHPDVGDYDVKIQSTQIEDGKTYRLAGHVKDKPSQLVVITP